jgi:uncharacterized protein DUF3572
MMIRFQGSGDFLRKGKHKGMVNRTVKTSRKTAEALAIQAFSFIAADSERLGRFLAASGLGPAAIRAAAGEPTFLAGVLDHVVRDELLLVSFATEMGTSPKDIVSACAALGGTSWEGSSS